MKKFYFVLAACIVMLSWGYNAAIAAPTTYTDYGVNTEPELNSALTTDDENPERIHIMSNINLQNNLSTPANNSMIINGNNKTINGTGNSGLITPATYTTTINDLTLTNFTAPVSFIMGSNMAFGGAILNQNTNLNIFNSHFMNNIADGGVASAGAAITNLNLSDHAMTGNVNIYNSTFQNNIAGVNNHGLGGAILNAGTMNVYNSAFTKNYSNPTNSDSDGGAIYNMITLNVYNSTFGTDNTADANKAYQGGAIYNDSTANIYNSTFTKNSASRYGGAIFSRDDVKIYDSTFTGNTAGSIGGAIYNSGTAYVIADKSDVNFINNTASNVGGAIFNDYNLYLIANNGGITFTGNTATTSGNDLYNSSYTYLNAGLGEITFNSGIDSTGSMAINSAIADIDGLAVSTTGRIILNSALTGTGNINIHGGTLKVGTAGSIGASGGGISTFLLEGDSILDLADGTVKQNNVYINSLTTASSTSSIWMDADLSLGMNAEDQINVGTYHMTTLPNFTLRILGDDTNPAAMGVIAPFAGDGDCFTTATKATAFTNHYKYAFTGNDSFFGFLDFVRTGDGTTYDGLQGSITDASAFRSFSLVGTPYVATSNLTALSNGTAGNIKTLTVFGTGKNGLAIDGNNARSLFSVPQYAQLNIVDAALKNAYKSGSGAAINNNGTLKVYDSLLTNNIVANNYGGAIYNNGNVYVNGSTFTNNSAGNSSNASGGAIFNSNTASVYNSTFTGNTARDGGAIYTTEGTTIISDSTFADNEGVSGGGAIYNYGEGSGSTIFVYNSIFGGDPTTVGTTTTNHGNTSISGGAIYNEGGIVNVNNSIFKYNKSGTNGGAVYNNNGEMNFYNTSFTNNTANDKGGAIYGLGETINLIASDGDVTFSGNTATNGGNDIYLTSGTKLNLNALLGNKISFGGGIKSSAITSGTININKTGSADAGAPPTNAPTTGEIVLGAPIETSTVNLYGGTLTLNNDSYLNGNALTLAGGTLNMQNGATGTMALNSLAVNGTTKLNIDADLAAGHSDTITGAYSASTSKLNVNSIRLLNDSTTTSTTTQLLGGDLAGHNLITMGTTKAYTPIYQYNVSYDDTTGKLAFQGGGSGGGSGSGGFNPSILSSAVSANVGAYMNQVAVYNEALGRSELFMSLPQSERLLMRYKNKYANIGGNDVQPEVFSPLFTPSEKGGIWFKQYTSFENVPLNNGPNVSNVGYGAMVGADSPMYHLKNGYDGYVTAYAGYNGSHQNYDNVGVYQNGGAIGLTGTLYKGNFFTALTASVGESVGQANTMYGTDNFNTLLAGLAWKTGYNIEMAQGKFILQPSLLAAYTFANTFDYTTASGVSMTSNPMNAIQIAPGAKFIYNAKNGWQPYLAANMVFNIMDTQKFQANDVQLPQMSIAPYFEYGLGVQRRWGDKFTGFGQAMLRGGGRNGIALQFGLRYAIGK